MTSARELAQETEQLEQVREACQACQVEKEALVQEVHHRVKNNLMIVSSMLALQAHSAENATAAQAPAPRRCL